MIVTDSKHFAEQVRHTPSLAKALDFLASLEGKNIADGRIEIDGENVFAMVQSYDTIVPGDLVKMEGHKKYIDVQYVASGEEVLGWALIERATVTMEYDAAKDAWLGTVAKADVTNVRLSPGQAAILYPSDAHAPRLAAGEPGPVKKIVVKVAV
jgi:biofilm protein TabA